MTVKKCSKEECNKCLKWIESSTHNTLEDCLRIKKELNLCDWAYVKMLDRFATISLDSTNEAVLLMYSLLTRSGYGALVNAVKNNLLLSYQSDAFVYNKSFFNYNDNNFYLYGDSIAKDEAFIRIAKEGNPIDFRYQGEIRLAEKLSAPRTIKSVKDSTFTFTVQVNKNLVDFYGDMPSVSYDNNFMTRWSTMAEYPLEKHLQQTLIKEMKEKLAGKGQKEQVQQILWWIHGRLDMDCKNSKQDTFLFAYDEDVWGGDRAFFAEESLFYPYFDSEDRCVLFSRVVRDVVGLDVLLVYYPGHLATAVCFNEPVEGSFYEVDGRKFFVCDPTYIGSRIGMEMPGMNPDEATIILVN